MHHSVLNQMLVEAYNPADESEALSEMDLYAAPQLRGCQDCEMILVQSSFATPPETGAVLLDV